jgi:hypothetical protein
MDRISGRWVILLATVALIAFVLSGLFGWTDHRQAEGGASEDLPYSTVCHGILDEDACNSWRSVALAQCVGVVFLAAAAWTYNERRAITSQD